MNDDLEQQLGDMVADGKATTEDADTIRTFAQLLVETGPPGAGQIPRRWLPYALGEADGPVDDPEEAERLIEAAKAKLGAR
jgi:hypothetical protein